MPRTPREVPAAELAVLQVLWRDGARSVRELAEELYEDGGASACATVQKLCERLEAKRLVAKGRGARPFRYAARVARGELIGRELESLAEKLCGGSFAPLLSHLMERGALSAAELAALREQLESAPRRAPRKRANERGRRGG